MREDGHSLAGKFLTLVCIGLTVAACGCSTSQQSQSSKIAYNPGPGFTSSASFDGRRLLTAQGGAAYLWDVETGKVIQRFQGHTGRISALALSPDGKHVVTTASREAGTLIWGESARFWDIATGGEIRQLTSKAWRYDVQFSPDGKLVLLAEQGISNGVQICDLKTGRALSILPPVWGYTFGYPTALYVSFSPDGRRILEITGRSVKIWDTRNGKEICAIEKTNGFFTTAHFSPDGKQVLTASYESHLTSEKKFTPDGNWFFIRAPGGRAQIWDAKTGRPIQEFAGHTNTVCHAFFTPDGRKIITASSDASARLWDTKTGKELRRFQNPGPIEQMIVSRDGKRLIARWTLVTQHGALLSLGASLWDVESGREMLQLTNRMEQIVGFSPLDQKFIAIKEARPVALWDGATGKLLRDYDRDVESRVRDYFQETERAFRERTTLVDHDLSAYGSAIIPYLERYLAHELSLVRIDALGLLGRLQAGNRAELALRTLREDSNAQVRAVALEVVRGLDGAELGGITEELKPLLFRYVWQARDPSDSPVSAIYLLERIGSNSITAELKTLQKQLRGKSNVRPSDYNYLNEIDTCQVVLARLGDKEALDEIRTALRRADPKEIATVIKMAALVGFLMKGELLDLLDDRRMVPHQEVRGSGDLRYRVREYAAQQIDALFGLGIATDLTEESIEEFALEVGGKRRFFKRYTDSFSNELVSRVQEALNSRSEDGPIP